MNDSTYWKNDLLKWAAALRKRMLQRRWTDASFARLEQTIMLGFYSIRKLHESKKLTDSVADQSLTVTAFPWSGKTVTRINWIRLDELYGLESPEAVSCNLIFLCNQFVHSYIFLVLRDKAGMLHSVVVSSDREKVRRLYSLTIDQVVSIFESIGNDDSGEWHAVFNQKKNDYDVTNL